MALTTTPFKKIYPLTLRLESNVGRLVIVLSLIFVSHASGRTTYYVSSSAGNDANNGTSTSMPWKTLNKINKQMPFSAGDSILLKRGDVWQGEISKTFIGTAQAPIVIGAYGIGAKPILYGDLNGCTWAPTPGRDSVYQTWAGKMVGGIGYEYSSGAWHLLANNVGEIRYYLSNPDSLRKYLDSFTASSFGPTVAWDTVYVKTRDGNPPKVHVFREGNFFYGSHVMVRDLDIRNIWSAVYTLNLNNAIFRNITTRNTALHGFYISNNSDHILVDSCAMDSMAATGMFDYKNKYNTIRANTFTNVVNSIMGLPPTYPERCIIGFQADSFCVAEYNTGDRLIDAFFDSGEFTSERNYRDTIRFNTITNAHGGMFVMGDEWTIHDNSISLLGSGSIGLRLDIKGTGQTTIYNNSIVTPGTGVWVKTRIGSGTADLYGNTINGLYSNTGLMAFEVGGITSTGNLFSGTGGYYTGTWPNQVFYATLAAFQAGTGLEAGSEFLGSPVLLMPSPGRSGVPLSFEARWQRSTGATRYQIQIAYDGSFTNPLLNDSTVVDTVYQVNLPANNTTYYCRVRAKGLGLWGPWSSIVEFSSNETGITPGDGSTPVDFFLSQNFPNPFNPSTVIRYGLPVQAQVRLEVFDTIGRRIAVLADGTQNAGYHEVTFAKPDLAAGVYLYRLTAGSFSETRRFVLLK
jgi:hypothetical protein